MKKWSLKDLVAAGYNIENARIDSVDLSMEDHGCLTLKIGVRCNAFGFVYGGYFLGRGYVGASDDYFSGSSLGMESIIRVMDVVGSGTFNGMKGKYVRCATKSVNGVTKIIGNIIEDKWFDVCSFYDEAPREE